MLVNTKSAQNEYLKILQELHGTSDPETRLQLLLKLVEKSLTTYNPADTAVHDDLHALYESFLEARGLYHTMAARLGRVLLQSLELELSMRPPESPTPTN